MDIDKIRAAIETLGEVVADAGAYEPWHQMRERMEDYIHGEEERLADEAEEDLRLDNAAHFKW